MFSDFQRQNSKSPNQKDSFFFSGKCITGGGFGHDRDDKDDMRGTKKTF